VLVVAVVVLRVGRELVGDVVVPVHPRIRDEVEADEPVPELARGNPEAGVFAFEQPIGLLDDRECL
jgi:hypothetical protein